MTTELSWRKEIFPKLKKVVLSLLHFLGDIMRLVIIILYLGAQIAVP